MTSTLRFVGAGTALVTPFTVSGEIDLPCFRALVHRQVDSGVRMLVPCGTTGESASLSRKEKELLVRACVEEVAGRAIVIAGAGGSDTRSTVSTVKDAARWGADAVLCLAPPCIKPPQDALVHHYRRVAEEAGVPVVIYNVPGRTGCNLDAETTLELAELDGIAAVKEASADMAQCMQILRHSPDGFSLLSGEDSLTWPLMAMGAAGVISVIGNEVPHQIVNLCTAALEGRQCDARELHFRLLPLMDANFVESNPIPVKAALSSMGLIGNHFRAPLRPLRSEYNLVLASALTHAGVRAEALTSGGVR